MNYVLTIYWHDEGVIKSKDGNYSTFEAAAKHGIDILNKKENNDMWAEISCLNPIK